MTHTTRIAVAMGSALDFQTMGRQGKSPSLQEAYELIAGGGCVEIYCDIADIAEALGAMLDEIGPVKQITWRGCFEYEVAEAIAEHWQQEVLRMAKEGADTGLYETPDVMVRAGRETLEFFTQDHDGSAINTEHAAFIASVVFKHTEYHK